MSKSKLRKEYEARMGVVAGTFRLYNAAGQEIYYECAYECAEGYWAKRKYNEAGKQVSFENSAGLSSRSKYNEAGKQVSFENSAGLSYRSKYNEAGTRVYYECAEGYWAKRKYNEAGKQVSFETFTDENGTQYKLVEMTK